MFGCVRGQLRALATLPLVSVRIRRSSPQARLVVMVAEPSRRSARQRLGRNPELPRVVE